MRPLLVEAPLEKLQRLRDLQVALAAVDAEPHVYEPRGVAAEVQDSTAPELLISGPAGTGKSRAALEKMHTAARDHPGMRGLICRKTRASLGSTGLVTWSEHVAVEALAADLVDYFGGSTAKAAQYRYRNGSTITVGGLDKASKIMSSEFDLIFAQEATELSESDWEALTTRLRHGRMPYQQIIADCNPDRPTHWLKVRCDRGRTVLLQSRHEDNPVLFDDAGQVTPAGASYIAKLDALTGVRLDRLRFGRWVAAEGLVYEQFDPAVHVIDLPDTLPDEWPRYWSVDFGYTNPFVLGCWAEDPDGRLILYRELYRTQRLVEDHARDILAIVAPHGQWVEPRPRAIVCDHDAEDRATLERYLGMSTTPARKGISDGVQAVAQRLRLAGDSRPRLLFGRGALVAPDPELVDAKKPICLVEELPGYVWDRPPATSAGDARPAKETPLKRDDHACLVAGSVVATDRGPAPVERIQIGDVVLTRKGWRTVIAAGMTNPAALVHRVELSNGVSLTGTGNHPVWVRGRGWTRLDSLRYADKLETCLTSRPRTAASGFARTTARAHGAGRVESIMSKGVVPNAAASSLLTGTRSCVAADVSVLSVSALTEQQPVYNLTVSDQPEFYAQGILVHNCDAARYVVAHVDLAPRPRVRWLG